MTTTPGYTELLQRLFDAKNFDEVVRIKNEYFDAAELTQNLGKPGLSEAWEDLRFIGRVLEAGLSATPKDRADAHWMCKRLRTLVHTEGLSQSDAPLTAERASPAKDGGERRNTEECCGGRIVLHGEPCGYCGKVAWPDDSQSLAAQAVTTATVRPQSAVQGCDGVEPDYEAVGWAYGKLLAYGSQNASMDNAMMMDRLKLMLEFPAAPQPPQGEG